MDTRLTILVLAAIPLAACNPLNESTRTANDYCAKDGKQAVIVEQNVKANMLVSSAALRVHCVDPSKLVATAARFGADVYPADDGRPGASVIRVHRDSAAARAGIKPDDLIVEYSGRPIAGTLALQEAVNGTAGGSRVPVRVQRGASFMETTVQF